MDDVLNYDKRDQLYTSIIEKLGLIKIGEKYSSECFRNFYIVVLAAPEFLLQYYNDRSYLGIEIASKSEVNKWFPLSFIKNYIYNPEEINPREFEKDDAKRIEALNDFLISHFDVVSVLFNKDNYLDTQQKLEKLLEEQFNRTKG